MHPLHMPMRITRVGTYICVITVMGLLPSIVHAQQTVTLTQVIGNALNSAPAISQAEAQIRVAQGARTTARSLPNPMLEYSRDGMSGAGGGTTPETMLMFSVPVAPFYTRSFRGNVADAELAAAMAEAKNSRQLVVIAAADAFFRAARSEVFLRASRDLVTWLDTLVSYNDARVREGTAAEVDLMRAQTDRDRAYADEAMNRADLSRAIADLRQYSVIPPDPHFVLDMNAPSTTIAVTPAVAAAQARLRAAQAATKVASSTIFEDANVSVGAKTMDRQTSVATGISIPLPLFSQNAGGRRQASAERDAAAAALDQEQRIAAANLEADAASVTALEESAGRLNRGFVERADEVRRIAFAAYREGSRTIVDVLDASRAWGDAQMTYANTMIALQEATLRLQLAHGFDFNGVAKQ